MSGFFRTFLLLLSLILTLGGCAPVIVGGAAAGAAAAYVSGELQVVENASVEEVFQAAVVAAKELKLRVESKEVDALSGKVVALGAEAKQVVIRLERQESDLTLVRIRVGVFGDRAYSLAILEEIERNIGDRIIGQPQRDTQF